jgi:hypothetical protein
MKVIAAVIGLSVFLTVPALAAAETCEILKTGGKRCEHIFSNSTMRTVVYSDRHGNILDWEINFPLDSKSNLPAVTLIEGTMAILTPSSTVETRSQTFRSLADNVAKAESKIIAVGNYDWVSAKLPEGAMMRASVRKVAGNLGAPVFDTPNESKKRGVNIGMTADDVRKSSWGKPQKINSTITANERHEQWVYSGGYLNLDNGVLTSIQTSR